MSDSRTDGEPRSIMGLASILFFASGMTGLIYEVIWFKRFTHVWGASSLAMTVVVASFLGGLGLGAFLLGHRADGVRNPLGWYGRIEIAIGVLAFLIPFEIALLFEISSLLPDFIMESIVLWTTVRFVLTFLVIGPTCVLMGATLPFLVRHFAPALGGGSATAWVYAINTFGAAVGCFLAGFYLLPRFGLTASNVMAVLLNIGLGGAAIALSRVRIQERAQSSRAAPVSLSEKGTSWNPKLLLAGAAMTGFAALALQIVWTRQLALVLGGTTYAFTAVLFVVLVGIALGSLIYRLVLQSRQEQAGVLAGILVVLSIGALVGKELLEPISSATGSLKPLRESAVWNAAVCVGASCALQFVPSVAMGVLFPWFVNAASFSPLKLGQGVGRLYAFNTVGTISGAIVATFVLLPDFGTGHATGLCLLLYFATWIVLLPTGSQGRQILALSTACVLLLTGGYAMRPDDPRVLGVGQYMYGFKPSAVLREQNKVLHQVDGASCSVLVRELPGGFRALSVNGKTDASDGKEDMPMQLGLAYLPAFLHPSASDFLIIGYGSGCTSGASLLINDARVTCCEIEPAVFEGSRFFSHVNHEPDRSPRLEMVFNDGRNHLQTTSDLYDLILSEPSNPWIAGVSNLFTREFYKQAKERLKDGGILAQWIQTYSIEPRDYAAIAATVSREFKELALLRVNRGDTILLASNRPIVPTAKQMDAAQMIVDRSEAISSDMRQYFGGTDVRSLLVKTLLLDTAGVARLAAKWSQPEDVMTDLDMRLEFVAPHALFRSESTAPAVTSAIFDSIANGWFADRLRDWGCQDNQVDALRELEFAAGNLGHDRLSRQLAREVLSVRNDEPHFKVSELLVQGASYPDELQRTVREAPIGEVTRLGVQLCAAQRFEEAAGVFRILSKRVPDSATNWVNLSVNLRASGREEEALEALKQARELDPLNDYVQSVMKNNGLETR